MAAARNRVTERDQGWERIKREIKAAEKAIVKVGILAGTDPHPEDGADMLLIAAANEFGTADGHVPSRPFIRGAFDNHRRDLAATKARMWALILRGKLTVDRSLGLLGEEHQGQVQRYMTALDTPPNAPSTIARKRGSSNPLINFGRLRAAIRWRREK